MQTDRTEGEGVVTNVVDGAGMPPRQMSGNEGAEGNAAQPGCVAMRGEGVTLEEAMEWRNVLHDLF